MTERKNGLFGNETPTIPVPETRLPSYVTLGQDAYRTGTSISLASK